MSIPYYYLNFDAILLLHADGFDIICDGDLVAAVGVKQK